MEPNQIKEQLDRIQQEASEVGVKAAKQIAEAVKDKADNAVVEQIKADFHEYTETAQKAIAELREIAEKQGMTIKGLTESGAQSRETPRQNIEKMLTANLDAFNAMKAGATNSRINIAVKAAATMATANILPTTAGAIPFLLSEGSNGEIIGIARRAPYLREVIGSRPINTMYATWAEQVNVDGGAATVAEGAAKPLADFDVQEVSRKVEKIAAYAKTTKELLADVPAMANFIEEELRTIVELKLDDQLYSGNGTTPNLKGLTQWATTLSLTGTGFATAGGGVASANNYDVVIATQAIMANTYKFTPNVMLVNPLDFGLMQAIKSTQGEYLIPPYAQSMSMNIAGITVVANPGVTAGDFIIMDTTKLRLRMREEFNISYGYENDDFTKNLVSVLGELRAVLYLPTNYAGAVLKGTFATVKAAMAP